MGEDCTADVHGTGALAYQYVLLGKIFINSPHRAIVIQWPILLNQLPIDPHILLRLPQQLLHPVPLLSPPPLQPIHQCRHTAPTVPHQPSLRLHIMPMFLGTDINLDNFHSGGESGRQAEM